MSEIMSDNDSKFCTAADAEWCDMDQEAAGQETEAGYKIAAITDITNKKRFVQLMDAGKSFALYNQEIRRLSLIEGEFISHEQYASILKMLEDRARNRALHIVTKRDVTEKQLTEKLLDGRYPKNVITVTIQFMKEHGFVNDARYASNYVWCKADTRSRRQMEAYLYSKGIEQAVIEQACDEYYDTNADAQNVLIRKLIDKKCHNLSEATYEEKSKIIAYLARKGFDYDNIQYVMNELTH